MDEEKDIGVMVHRSLKPTRQCSEAHKRAMNVLRQISHAFHYRDKKVFLNLYTVYVRPHLEFSVSAWSPWTRADIDLLEKVQMKAINMISGLVGQTYSEKLVELGIQSLEERRVRFDMVETFKTVHGINKLDKHTFFEFVAETSERTTRLGQDPLNLKAKRFNTDVRKNFWSVRVVKPWNDLPSDIKHASSLGAFKSLYDNHVELLQTGDQQGA